MTMEATPIYSKPVKNHRTDELKRLDPAAEVVKKFTSKYDTIQPINGGMSRRESRSPPAAVKRVTPTGGYVEQDSMDEEVAEITEQELMQVESFFRSQQTQVYVCECLANLYHMTMGPSGADSTRGSGGNGRCPSAVSTSSWSSGRSDSSSESSTLASSPEWSLALTGIPVLLFDRGQTRARSKRRLQIVLAERGSGFALWFDVIDNLSNYRSLAPNFHAMHFSGDHRQMVGFSFDRGQASSDFLRRVELLTADPLNISLSVPKNKRGKRRAVKRSTSVGPVSTKSRPNSNSPRTKSEMPRKSDISLPCCFQHVTSVDLNDKEKLFSLATLVNGLQGMTLNSDHAMSLITRNASSLTNSPSRTKSSSDIHGGIY